MKRVILSSIIILSAINFLVIAIANSAVINAESCSLSHVESALDRAASGDTVVVPSGSATWSSGVTIPPGVRVFGAGIGGTVISSPVYIITYLGSNSCLSGFEFSNGIARPSQGRQNWVIKECNFGNTTGARKDQSLSGINTDECQTGVYHRCTFVDVKFTIEGKHLGEEEWAYPDDLGGTDHVVYIEGCTFTQNQGSSDTGATGDSSRGGQAVWRLNTFYDGLVQTHGGRGGTNRGTRKVEFYRNTFHRTWNTISGHYAFWDRGGVYILFDNDCNDASGSCDYNIDTPRVYYDGWPGGKCAADNIYDTTPHPATGTGHACQDATGLGQDVNPPSPGLPADQHNQTYSPGYFWNNEFEGTTGEFYARNGAENFIIEGRDYFLDASSHADYGLGGVTHGLWANRPTCNASRKNHSYWAIDKGGDWCKGCDDGALYVCDGIDTWNLYYTPAPYPHPLVGPSPPQNLKITN